MTKYFVFLMMIISLVTHAQTANLAGSTVIKTQRKLMLPNEKPMDSVVVQNEAAFIRFQYEGAQYKMQDGIRFTLRVTNNGSTSIPDIQVSRGSDLHIYINEEEAMEVTIGNYAINPGADNSIAPGKSDTFDLELQITGPDAIDYGNIFTFQWEYHGLRSNIIRVDISKKLITSIPTH